MTTDDAWRLIGAVELRVDERTTVCDARGAVEEILGRDPVAVAGLPLAELFDPRHAAELPSWLADEHRGAEPLRLQVRSEAGTGWVDLLSGPWEPRTLLLRDVSREVELERQIAATAKKQQEFHRALDNAVIMAETDAEGVITWVNSQFVAISGYPAEELLGRTHRQVKSRMHSSEVFATMWQTITWGQVWQGEVCNKRSDGSLYWVLATITPVLGADGRPERYIAVRHDITRLKDIEHRLLESTEEISRKNAAITEQLDQLKEAQSQLLLAEKLASLGMLVSGVAHEINNPVTFLIGGARVLGDRLGDLRRLVTAYEEDASPQELAGLRHEIGAEYLWEDLDDAVQSCVNGSARVAEIVATLRTFSRMDRTAVQNFDVREGLTSTLQLVRFQYKHAVQFHLDLDPVSPMMGNPGQINQVFMNLLINACQSRAEGAEVWLSLRETDTDLVIAIKDNGCGIAPEHQASIFTPFFTTKPQGQGTGLGLSICHSIVSEHGGRIEFHSGVGHGTEFVLHLPKAQEASQ